MTQRQSWIESLSFLNDDAVESLVPLLERVALVVEAAAIEQEGTGEPNGFGGITRRGPLDRLLLSEWLYATEEPDEFMRRFVNSELSYLQPEQTEPAGTTRLEVLVDSGPQCLGAVRLVHLLALVVLSKRADQLGIPFAIGVLGETPGSFTEGPFAESFPHWLKKRMNVGLGDGLEYSDCEEWNSFGMPNAHRWLLTGGPSVVMPSQTPNDVQVLCAHIAEWSDVGVAALKVEVGNRSVTLPLTDQRQAIRVLRGDGLRTEPISRPTNAPVENGAVRFPRFTGSAPRLLMRGESADVLISMGLTGRTRRFQFRGPVVAAGTVGDRVVAVVIIDSELRIQIFGKKLGRVDNFGVPLLDLPFDPWGMLTTDLPMLLFSDEIHLCVEGTWYAISGSTIEARSALLMASSAVVDQPRRAYQFDTSLHFEGQVVSPVPTGLKPDEIFFGVGESLAFWNGGYWELCDKKQRWEIRLQDETDNVVGVTVINSAPWLVTRSADGYFVRLQSHFECKEITVASGWLSSLTVHPTLPLLGVQRSDGQVDIVDLRPKTVVASFQPGGHQS